MKHQDKTNAIYSACMLEKWRSAYPLEIMTTTMVIAPVELDPLMRGHTGYLPLNKQEYNYFFELETDAEYFKSRYGKL